MDSNVAIQNLYDQDGLLDILLGVEEYLDNMDLYAYKNWILGELVEGPIVSKYWVETTFKYYHDSFPDPRGAMIFENQGTLVSVRKEYEMRPIQHPRSEDDMQVVASQSNTGNSKLPKDERLPILLVKFRIPRRLVNPESFDEYKENASDFNQNSILPEDGSPIADEQEAPEDMMPEDDQNTGGM